MTLSKPSRDLFRAAKDGGTPSRADRDRVRGKVDRRVAAAGAAAVVGTLATKTAAGTSGLGAAGLGFAAGTVAKIVVPIVVLGVAVTATTIHVVRRDHASAAPSSKAALSLPAAPRPETPVQPRPFAAPEPPAPTTEVATPALPPSPPLAPPLKPALTPAPAPAPARAASPSPALAPTLTPAPAPPLAPSPAPALSPSPALAHSSSVVSPPPSELALVEAMNSALSRGDAATTLGLASEHARLYPAGTLAEERDGARALALCMVGTTSAAREFLSAHPSSPLVGRLRAVCETNADSLKGSATPGQ